ncbi:hypothetical protein [Methylopila turkensis]|uniref:Secreted protein n=1 Tax=Methylopila turkensis TaxID=1437816 RepID=A0A9W6N8B2_9HYPH|nr:hypothetical protein [Methylopila turkensis]GLK81267.1 hypothetical protein GCM10008174_30080 [Methylopila turkensis]
MLNRFAATALLLGAFVAPALASDQNEPRPGAKASPTPSASDLGMALMSAAVRGDGLLVRGEGADGAGRLSVGAYEVNFGRDITNCALTATVGIVEAYNSPPSLIASVSPRAGTPTGVFVRVFDVNGVLADGPFHLTVFCGR